MVGLHGAGKTTSSGKLARLIQKQGRQPLLVAADVYRPAAMDQLETLGKQLDLPVFVKRGETDVLKIAREALAFAETNKRNAIIFDTAGRLQIDEPLVQELVRLRDLVKPQEILLVLDAATGQEAVNVATHFDQALNITGSILTKLDGDARGGAALSMKSVTGKPIKFMGVGEKLDEFEPFHPERMASRILGMGDVVSLVEKAAEAVDMEDAKRMEEKMRKGEFTLEDFLEQLRQMKKLGPARQHHEDVARRRGSVEAGGHRQAGTRVQAHGSDDLRHDAEGTCDAANPECQTPHSHRQRQRRDRDGIEHHAEQVRPDAADDEKDGQVSKMMGKMGGGMPGMFGR
jgi:signal recognition particle GTPase